MASTRRRLAAVLVADVAGYSRLMEMDESGTLQGLRTYRAELIDPQIAVHNGRLVKTTGDGLLVEFGSVVDALRCAAEVQAGMAERNATVSAEKRIEFRIGINVGDIVIEDDDILGDGVNVAARLEGLAEPGGICVSGRVQEDVAGRLDLAFEDMGEQTLKNIGRRVRVYRVRDIAAPKSSSAPASPALALPDKPSIAVLPFQNITGDPEQEYFVDGMVEEIITALSRIRWLFVLARNSSFTYKGQVVDVKRVGRELGVRYVLQGSVRKAGNRVRITGQLIEAETGAHLWAERFDGLLEDVFDLQDKVASSVAGVLEPALQAAEIRRSVERPRSDLTAYDLYLRALSLYEGGRAGVQEALELLGRAIERDPGYGPALALAAHCHQVLDIIGWSDDPATNRNEGIDLARKALRVARDDPDVLGRAATRSHISAKTSMPPSPWSTAPGSFTRASPSGGSAAAGSGCGAGNPTWRSSISRLRCASALVVLLPPPSWGSVSGMFLADSLRRPGPCCSVRCRSLRTRYQLTDGSQSVARIWDGLRKPER